MAKVIFIVLMAMILTACATSQPRELDPNYSRYLETIAKPMPVMEIKAKPGEQITINAESITFYAVSGSGNGQRAIAPPVEPDTPAGSVARAIGGVASRAVDQAAVFLPWYWLSKAAENVLMKSYDAAGHDTTISGSYNTDRHDSGSWRDFSGNVDQSNRSINSSYNPFDRHDVFDVIYPAPVPAGQ